MELEKVSAKYKFREDKLQEISKGLARTLQEIEGKQEEKKAVTAQYGTEIKRLELERDRARDCIGNGFEYRTYLCELKLDFQTKRRLYYDAQTGEFVKDEPFRPEDHQLRMGDNVG